MAAPLTPVPTPRQQKKTKIITLTVVGVVSLMVVGFCAAQDDREDVSADCVNLNAPLEDGSYPVMDDSYCNGTRSNYGGVIGAYGWYYAGSRIGARVLRGTTVRPSDVNISSRGGHVIQRGGFGGRGGSGGS